MPTIVPFLRYTVRGNTTDSSAPTLCFLHGWPDPSSAHTFKEQIAHLEASNSNKRIVLLDLPGYGPERDPAYDDFPSWRPPTVDEISVMLRATVKHVMAGRTCKTLPSIVAHDWGSIIVNAAIYNEYAEQKREKNNSNNITPLFDKVIMLDVGGEVNPLQDWGIYAVFIVLLYQSLAAFSFLLPQFLGDKLHRGFTKLFKVPHFAQSRGRMGYLYVFILSTPLLWGSKALMWYARDKADDFSDYRALVKNGVMYAVADKKPFPFDSKKWRSFCRDGKKNQLVEYPTIDHWFFLRSAHVVDFNAQMSKFLS